MSDRRGRKTDVHPAVGARAYCDGATRDGVLLDVSGQLMPRLRHPSHPSVQLKNVTSILKNSTHDPYRGTDDPDFGDETDDRPTFFDELHELLDTVGSDHITTLTASLKSFALLPSGRGFELKFEMGLDQRDKLPVLSMAVQRLVRVDVTKYRKARDHD